MSTTMKKTTKEKKLVVGDKTKVFIPFPKQEGSTCRGENIWVQVLQFRETDQGVLMKCKLLNTPVSKEYHDIDWGDAIIAQRGVAGYERWICVGKAPKEVVN